MCKAYWSQYSNILGLLFLGGNPRADPENNGENLSAGLGMAWGPLRGAGKGGQDDGWIDRCTLLISTCATTTIIESKWNALH